MRRFHPERPALPPHRQKRRRPDPEARAAFLFLLPSVAGTALFVLLPFAETVRRSFFDAPGRRFVGLENYRSVLQNSAFQLAAKNTARFLCTCVPALLLISLLLALGDGRWQGAATAAAPAGAGCCAPATCCPWQFLWRAL